MKTLIKSRIKVETCKANNGNFHLPQKVNNLSNLMDIKFYQKSFLLLIVFSTILIFPESPKELENICKYYHSRQVCNIW